MKNNKACDRCQYYQCNNGKHKGHHLFRFPSELTRQKIWIQNSGNKRLLYMASATVHAAGLCAAHFKNEDFTNETKSRLKRNRDPMHWEAAQSLQEVVEAEESPQEVDVQRNCDALLNQSVLRNTTVDESSECNFSNIAQKESSNCVPSDNAIEIRQDVPESTYPSGKEIFFNICEVDADTSYLHYEIPKEMPKSESQYRKKTVLSSKKNFKKYMMKFNNYRSKCLSLELKIKQLQQTLKNQKNKNSRLRKRLEKEAAKRILTIEDFLKDKDITPVAQTMIKLQLHKNKSAYTNDEKDLCKMMYFHSAAAYSRLRNAGLCLPSESTVRAWVSEYNVFPGLNHVILEKIKLYFNSLPPIERICALKFDEMSIKAYEEYSKSQDLIEGLIDMGSYRRSRGIAKHALLFMLDSLNAKNPWRQLIWFGFNENGASADELFQILNELIRALRNVGADVRLIVCDQGSNNRKLFSNLNIISSNPYFYIDGVKIFACFDWPHLIKRLIAQLRTYNNIYIGESIIMSFKDLIKTWQLDQSHGTSNLLGHLTERHFNPNSFDAMKVKLAFQLLSRRMACAIKLAGEDPHGLQTETWKLSASFVEKLDAVIDACNCYYLHNVNQQKKPLSNKHPEIQQLLNEFVLWSKKWSIKHKNKTLRPPCFSGIPLTVTALLQLFKHIESSFPDFQLATALCNQDSVEHVHSKLRGRGGFNANPTCRLYRLTFRHILSTDFIESSKKGNVVIEEAHSLLDTSKVTSTGGISPLIAQSDAEIPEYNSEEMREIEELLEAAEMMDIYIPIDSSDEQDLQAKSVYEANAIAYLAGYVARKSLKKSGCSECEMIFIKNSEDPVSCNEMYIEDREYPHSDLKLSKVNYLMRPTDIFMKVIHCQLETFHTHYHTIWHQRKLLQQLTEITMECTRRKFPDWFNQSAKCFTHRLDALKYLLLVKIFAKTREHNNSNKCMKKHLASKNQKLINVKNL